MANTKSAAIQPDMFETDLNSHEQEDILIVYVDAFCFYIQQH